MWQSLSALPQGSSEKQRQDGETKNYFAWDMLWDAEEKQFMITEDLY